MNDPIADEVNRLVNEVVRHRKRMGITVKEVTQRTGVGGAAWYSWVEGKCMPSMYSFVMLLNALGLRLRIEQER